jgi:hypothetical protein
VFDDSIVYEMSQQPISSTLAESDSFKLLERFRDEYLDWANGVQEENDSISHSSSPLDGCGILTPTVKLQYDWKSIKFWVQRMFFRRGDVEDFSKIIMDFIRCKDCFIGEPNYDWYVKATELNKLNVVKAIPSWGCEIEPKVNKLLFTACESKTYNNVELVKYLLERGADVKATRKSDERGYKNLYTPLDTVCEKRGFENKYTPLDIACYGGNLDVVKYLIEEKRADVKAFTLQDLLSFDTPLHYACYGGNLDVVKYLVEEKGADMEKQNLYDETPFHYACWHENLDIVKYLVEHGADMEAKNNDNDTALHIACRGKLDLVKYLVEHGADMGARRNCDETPIDIASFVGNFNIINYLIEQGGDVEGIYH